MGWARANVVYDKTQGMPEYGTIEETMFLLLWYKRQAIKVGEVRALAQSSLGGSEAEDAFKEYISKVSNTRDTSGDFLLEAAKKLMDEGPVYVIPIANQSTRTPKLRRF